MYAHCALKKIKVVQWISARGVIELKFHPFLAQVLSKSRHVCQLHLSSNITIVQNLGAMAVVV